LFRRLPAVLTLAAALCAAVPAASASAAPSPTGLAHKHKHVCVAKSPADSACTSEVVTDAGGVRPAATATYANGYQPGDLQAAYGLTAASAANGAGHTIAIVDAYDLPSAAQDLNTYRSQFKLPAVNSGTGPTFTKVNQTGGSTPPAVDTGWGQEIALDLDMASAVCPNCNILLVEASTSSMANLAAAVNTAAGTPGVVAISNSYGGGDYYPNSAYNHPGIAITASSGDNGYGASYPASDPHVVAVGGTSLARSTTSARGWTETAWSGAGSGCSSYNTKASWQGSVNTGCSRRGETDVSAIADPSTGVAVYDSTPDSTGAQGWMVFGGTSVASPIVGSVYALADNWAANSYPASLPYAHTSSLNDVTSGSNGRCRTTVWCNARTGWDGPTGLGTPNGLGAF
jgi:subtilase family serine protease